MRERAKVHTCTLQKRKIGCQSTTKSISQPIHTLYIPWVSIFSCVQVYMFVCLHHFEIEAIMYTNNFHWIRSIFVDDNALTRFIFYSRILYQIMEKMTNHLSTTEYKKHIFDIMHTPFHFYHLTHTDTFWQMYGKTKHRIEDEAADEEKKKKHSKAQTLWQTCGKNHFVNSQRRNRIFA